MFPNARQSDLCVDAVDWVSHVLPRGDDEREGEEAHYGERVVQAEDGGVDVNMADL
jgi:hypothetical protein